MPAKISVTGMDPVNRATFASLSVDYERWKLGYLNDQLESAFPFNSLVYLSADSENVLETLDESKIYVIGGLVDRNRHKNAAHERATKLGIETARLPLDAHIKLSSSQVLTTVHVFEILLKFNEVRSWKDAIVSVIPERKVFFIC